MAEGHTVEEVGKRWRIRLRAGRHFHDGEPVLARDCAASIKRSGRRDVLGVEILRISDEISGIDDRTLEFRLMQSSERTLSPPDIPEQSEWRVDHAG